MFLRVTQLTVVNLTIQLTGTYNQMYYRPYSTTMNEDVINVISDVATQYNSVTSALIAPVASAFITPSTNHTGNVYVPGVGQHHVVNSY